MTQRTSATRGQRPVSSPGVKIGKIPLDEMHVTRNLLALAEQGFQMPEMQ